MAELAATTQSLGLQDVSTYIQSGNVLLTSRRSAARIERELTTAITETFGLSVPVVVRSADALANTVAANPYLPKTDDLAAVHTFFLALPPPSHVADALDTERSPGDHITVAGDAVYVWFGNGAARSKITAAWLDKQLGTTATARNAKTLAALLALLT